MEDIFKSLCSIQQNHLLLTDGMELAQAYATAGCSIQSVLQSGFVEHLLSTVKTHQSSSVKLRARCLSMLAFLSQTASSSVHSTYGRLGSKFGPSNSSRSQSGSSSVIIHSGGSSSDIDGRYSPLSPLKACRLERSFARMLLQHDLSPLGEPAVLSAVAKMILAPHLGIPNWQTSLALLQHLIV